jgi:hypothetical protein
MQKLQNRVAARVSSSRRRVIVPARRGASYAAMAGQLDAAGASLKAARHGRKSR